MPDKAWSLVFAFMSGLSKDRPHEITKDKLDALEKIALVIRLYHGENGAHGVHIYEANMKAAAMGKPTVAPGYEYQLAPFAKYIEAACWIINPDFIQLPDRQNDESEPDQKYSYIRPAHSGSEQFSRL
ncbi:hypothetical protein [Iodobacter fluviatilis]|uniref:Uncharacterized protein n=1 Tax=Iodobacter fluviatilis TaxID=537 RepID=A0A7G3GEM9_9NEIS|nr:hypothetical protein [Iodobacter fluviatilis]QBC45851.1 hypothetical protein C1H71_20120 [Iodobacter fluviatilis]